MSEHMSITGKCDFQHMPMDEPGGFAYCSRCKKLALDMRIELHQGITGDMIIAKCGKCKKSIWVVEDIKRVLVEDDKNCAVCGKKTNYYDSGCVMTAKHTYYFCSVKCEKQRDKVIA